MISNIRIVTNRAEQCKQRNPQNVANRKSIHLCLLSINGQVPGTFADRTPEGLYKREKKRQGRPNKADPTEPSVQRYTSKKTGRGNLFNLFSFLGTPSNLTRTDPPFNTSSRCMPQKPLPLPRPLPLPPLPLGPPLPRPRSAASFLALFFGFGWSSTSRVSRGRLSGRM